MRKILYLYIFSFLLSLIHTKVNKTEEGNIMLLMEGTRLEINLEGKKVGNKNYYTVPIKVGNPSKIYNVQIDTSTSTTWLPSVDCKNCAQASNLYDPLKSKTSVTEMDDDFRDHFDGKLGLGFRNENGKNFNFLDRLKKQNLINKKIFSINQISEQKGLLFIGDNSANKYTFCNVSSGEDLDDIYKESWVCELTHVGIFNKKEGISNILTDYTHISDGKVDFDSAYEYIAVPICDRQIIEELLEKANLKCETNEEEIKQYKKLSKDKKEKLINKYNDEEISIKCKTSKEELSKNNFCLSFILQGNVYSIPLESLFSPSLEKGKMEMKIKYIDDDDAIWTFGFPFMSQFLMIFNMEENHVGIKSIKKTALPVLNITKEWNSWNEVYNNFFYKKLDITLIIIISTILFVTLMIIVAILVWRAFRKSELRKSQELIKEMKDINAQNNKQEIF